MNPDQTATPTTQLMQRAVAGDQISLTVLLSFVHARLRAHLEKRVPRDIQTLVDVDDIVQETQIQVFHHISSFRNAAVDSFYRWVATIALHRLRNVIKAQRALKRGRARTLLSGNHSCEHGSMMALLDWLAGPDNSPSQHASRSEAQDALAIALAGLPEHYRQAVRLVYLEGRSVEEAASLMGRTNRAIHNLCYKAKEQLHMAMGSTSRFFSRP